MNRLQKFKAIRRKDNIGDSSKAIVSEHNKSGIPGSNILGNDAGSVPGTGQSVDNPVNCHRSVPVKTKAEQHVNAGQIHANNGLKTEQIGSHVFAPSNDRTTARRLLTKPRSGSAVPFTNRDQSAVNRDVDYQESLQTPDLTGRASLSSRDLVFGIPPAPVRPPRLLIPTPKSLQRARSTPDINVISKTATGASSGLKHKTENNYNASANSGSNSTSREKAVTTISHNSNSGPGPGWPPNGRLGTVSTNSDSGSGITNSNSSGSITRTISSSSDASVSRTVSSTSSGYISRTISSSSSVSASSPLDPGKITPRDILRVMKSHAEAPSSEDEGNESGSEESYVTWSDDDDRSIVSAGSSGTDSFYENLAFRDTQLMDKAHRIALELTTTEETYVRKLEILDKARRGTEEILGNEVGRQIFPNIHSIYTLHKENMLPHLKERLSAWDTTPQIGDVMKTFSPYLKMYTDYVKNFDDALNLVGTWNAKNAEFSKMLRSLTPHGASLNLKLQLKSHMLEPVQRVPRYRLLLQQYLKEIDKTSAEYEDLQVALDSVSQAAQHFEDMMKHGTVIGELSDIQRQIDCPISLISSTRHLVRQGRIGKVNATTGKIVDRYIFLFNDLFLVCNENMWLTFYFYKYKVRQLMEVDAMQVTEGDNLDVPFTFYIKTKKKTVELCANDEAELEDWKEELKKTIGDRVRKKLSRTTAVNKRRTMMLCPDGQLGKEAPTWINNSQVTMCMLCAASFTVLRKKHHCRACGVVACHGCSSHSVPLEYDDNAIHRVCDECYLLLQDTSRAIKQHSTFQPKSREMCVHRGYLQISTDTGYSWRRRWFEFHADHKLYCYKAQQDISPMLHTQLSECVIDQCTVSGYGTKLIRIRTGKQTASKTYLLRPEKSEILDGWIDAFRTLSVRVHTTS